MLQRQFMIVGEHYYVFWTRRRLQYCEYWCTSIYWYQDGRTLVKSVAASLYRMRMVWLCAVLGPCSHCNQLAPTRAPAQLLFNLCPQGRVSIVLAIESKNLNQCVVIISAAVFQCTNQGKILNQRLKWNTIQMLPFRNGLWRMSTMKSNPVKQAWYKSHASWR